MNKYIVVKFQKEGIHFFKNVVNRPELKCVDYLQYPHRHIFYFEAKIEVFHDDRDLEIITVKNYLLSQLQHDFKGDSCETLCQKIYALIIKQYGNRKVIVQCLEDNENGAYIEF